MRNVLRRPDRRRGVQMIEFALILPIFILLLLFSIDVSRLMMLNGVAADATFQAARQGAQRGTAGDNNSGPSREAFYAAIDAAPGIDASDVLVYAVVSGGRCETYNPHRNVTIRTAVEVPTITPFLGVLSQRIANTDYPNANGFVVENTSVARCEVVR